ncbi:MAG: tellurite resistance TerB family protein [Rhodospirillales bacterium]
MIERIRRLVMGFNEPMAEEPDNISVGDAAACALLVDAASIDGDFDLAERRTIAGLLAAKFELDTGEVEALIEEAVARVSKSVDHYGFARQVKEAYDHDARVDLIEMLWQVAYADGVVDDFEANLMRRLAGLLHVSDRESGDARKRVLERLDN